MPDNFNSLRVPSWKSTPNRNLPFYDTSTSDRATFSLGLLKLQWYYPETMYSKTFLPSISLQPYIQFFLIIECEEERVNRILPDSSVMMAFRLKGIVNDLSNPESAGIPALAITGLRLSARLLNYKPNTSTLIVRFKPGGAAAFFNTPIHEFFEESISLDLFMRASEISSLDDQFNNTSDQVKKIEVLERFFLEKLTSPVTDHMIRAAIGKIQAAHGNLRIKSLANELFISNDAFEKRFRKAVGSSPKQFSSIIRMRSLIRQGEKNPNFAELALDAGYYDQPHFNSAFKKFTGLTPVNFFRAPIYW